MSVVIVEEGEGLALTLQLEKLQKEWEEKKTQSVEVRKVLDDLKLHKLRMKKLAEELSVAEAWEIELEARRLRSHSSRHCSVSLTSWRTRNLLVINFCERHL